MEYQLSRFFMCVFWMQCLKITMKGCMYCTFLFCRYFSFWKDYLAIQKNVSEMKERAANFYRYIDNLIKKFHFKYANKVSISIYAFVFREILHAKYFYHWLKEYRMALKSQEMFEMVS
jgi:hypothetical protein